jgi:hypothetical protein
MVAVIKAPPLNRQLRWPAFPVSTVERQIFFRPSFSAAVEDICRCTGVTKPRGNTLAELLARPADRDDRLSEKVRRPLRDIGMAALSRAWNEVGIGFEVFVDPYVDECGARSSAYQAGQFVGDYRVNG